MLFRSPYNENPRGRRLRLRPVYENISQSAKYRWQDTLSPAICSNHNPYEDTNMEHKTHQEDTVTIHWHDELLEIPKWIIEGYAEENISLDDKYLDELYSYRRPPIFSFQTEPEYNHVFTSLMIAKLNGIRAKKSLGKFVMYGSDGRSEERRVGKECSEPCRSRWSPYH